ncbi:hypothetical protein CIB48_g12030 [Xylaria polymorpha]|nr:hypothetical protein CIB48_g12030 [Xylaria polymorpha]
MPLDLMVVMTGTRYLNEFHSNIFIKGFNTMLVPVKQSEDLLLWHLLYSEDPLKRISYISSNIECSNLSLADLQNFRHVLGWCADATSIVASMDIFEVYGPLGRERQAKLKLKKKPEVDLKDKGAVIFDHNTSLHWHWKDSGDAAKGDPPLAPVIITDVFEDSGLGSSQSSSKVLTTPGLSSSGSTGNKSPTPHRVNAPVSPEHRPAAGSQRPLHVLVSSVSKKLKR